MTIEHFPGGYKSHRVYEKFVELKSENNVLLRIHLLSDNIIRFRYATVVGFEDDFSYAIADSFHSKVPKYEIIDVKSELIISLKNLNIEVNKIDFKVRIYDKKGVLILEDEKGFHWEENDAHGGNIVQMSKTIQDSEHYYGMGDKPVHPNLRGKRLVNWGTDEYGYHRGTDPIYKNIPFYIGLHHDIGYGVFFDNTFKSYFDFGSERKTVTSFWANGGEMNYYFIYGPDMLDVSRQYAQLTGTPEMPPMWALGYHQCKWSYYPESQVREITQKFRDLKIPCDAFYLDIDYMDGFRCFTWDNEKFPNPKQMVDDLKAQGFKTIVIIDPGIKIDPEYDVFMDGLRNNVYCRRADGPHVKGKVWPGDCYFPDFTNPRVRAWWAELFQNMISEVGVKGVWNDMNEPALFEVPSKTFPDDVRHDFDGQPCSHRKAHNVYGMQMSRATYDGVKKFSYPERPFVITRSTYSGGQRFSSAWTGDNIANWEHLWLANVQVQRMNISGFGFVGSDVGGFIEHPSPELYVRWVQLATFHPFFRTHSSGDHGEQEPWSFGEDALNIVRKYIEMRYQLLPYLYTMFYQYISEGTPMIRPVNFHNQKDRESLNRADEVLIGDQIMVCPIIEPNALGRYIYMPTGEWFDYWTDNLVEGGKEQYFKYSLETSPIFIKSGAVVPHYPVMQYVGEITLDKLTLHIYLGNQSNESIIYEDAGDGYGYKEGQYSLKKFSLQVDKDGYTIIQSKEGDYDENYASYEIVLHGKIDNIKSITIDGEKKSYSSTLLVQKNFNTIIIK